jgi:hypothetical protein
MTYGGSGQPMVSADASLRDCDDVAVVAHDECFAPRTRSPARVSADESLGDISRVPT